MTLSSDAHEQHDTNLINLVQIQICPNFSQPMLLFIIHTASSVVCMSDGMKQNYVLYSLDLDSGRREKCKE